MNRLPKNDANDSNDKNKANERFYVWWHCPHTNSREMAGVAYYNEKNGDYRLILNFFPDNHYFVKPMGGEAGRPCRYRLISMKPMKERGGRTKIFTQGEGFLDPSTHEIIMQPAPFFKQLVVSLRDESKNSLNHSNQFNQPMKEAN